MPRSKVLLTCEWAHKLKISIEYSIQLHVGWPEIQSKCQLLRIEKEMFMIYSLRPKYTQLEINTFELNAWKKLSSIILMPIQTKKYQSERKRIPLYR